ncbi:MAG: hypothetical protein HY647_01390 [Acidobacteria bacterium]|nr:hypothetical protein [Acidobacteriota bacterium]
MLCLCLSLSGRLAAQDTPGSAQTPPSPVGISLPSLDALTLEGKFHYYLKETYGPSAFLGSAASAAINQGRDQPSAWGQGMEGYGRRFGSSFAQRGVQNSIQFAVGALRGEDPRYFPSRRSGAGPRIANALSQIWGVQTDSGSKTLAIGRLSGAFGGGLISRAWQPAGHDGFRDGLESAGIQLGLDAAWNVFHEFWPDIKKRLFKRPP